MDISLFFDELPHSQLTDFLIHNVIDLGLNRG